jgi:hypothetical protein
MEYQSQEVECVILDITILESGEEVQLLGVEHTLLVEV